MIWAQDRHGTIGAGTDMLWHVPADFAFFKATTSGHPVVMGRATWESLDGALPGRRNIVLTRDRSFSADGADVVHSLEDAIALGEDAEGGDLVWITGGAQVYAEALGLADLLVVSELDLDVTTGRDNVASAPPVLDHEWELDGTASDDDWRPVSGDARWRVWVYRRR
ncbi:MAG: dihydrofolate reductase [Actinomycetota bacterium]